MKPFCCSICSTCLLHLPIKAFQYTKENCAVSRTLISLSAQTAHNIKQPTIYDFHKLKQVVLCKFITIINAKQIARLIDY